MERDGGEGHGEELGHPQSSRKAQVEHGAIAYPRACPDIRGIQNGVHLGNGKVLKRGRAVFFVGMASIRRLCSKMDGTRYSTKRMNEVMAAKRVLRVLGRLPRSASRYARNSTPMGARRSSS